MSNINATDKVKSKLLLGSTQDDVAEYIGISRKTLSNRLKNHNWKKSELHLINQW